MAGVFTQALVTRYAKLAALRRLIDKWLEAKRAIIVEALSAQRACPDRGPFLLVLTVADNPPGWKQEFADYLKAEGKTDLEVFSILSGIAAKPRKQSLRVETKANPNYRRTFPVHLPK